MAQGNPEEHQADQEESGTAECEQQEHLFHVLKEYWGWWDDSQILTHDKNEITSCDDQFHFMC